MKRALACAALLAIGLGGAAPGRGADQTEEGRRHAQKGSRLSAQGKCARAIPEFSAAYRLLHDPALLFNRAECLRKLGNKAAAAGDYTQFLTDMPSAPNRAEVEKRIVELGGTPPEAPAAAEPPTKVAAQPPAPPALAAVAEASPDAGTEAGAASAEQAADGGTVAAAEEPTPATEALPPPEALTMPPLPEVPSSALQIAAAPPPPAPSRSSKWVWIGAGALVVAAGAFGAWFAFGRSHTDVPVSSLGNYRF